MKHSPSKKPKPSATAKHVAASDTQSRSSVSSIKKKKNHGSKRKVLSTIGHEKTAIYTVNEYRNIPKDTSSNDARNTFRVTNILDSLKKEYDIIEQAKHRDNRKMMPDLNSAALGKRISANGSAQQTWSERSQTVREKLDEIMKKHSQALKSLSNVYYVPKEKDPNSITLAEQILNAKWPPKPQPRSPSDLTRSSQVQGVNKDIRKNPRQESATRFNSAAIYNIGLKRENSQSKQSYTKNLLTAPYHIRDEVKVLREKVDQAIRSKRTFTICGAYHSIRHALLIRGWVEKFHHNYIPPGVDPSLFRRLQILSIPELSIGLKDKELYHIYRMIIISKMIANNPVAFYWDINRDTYRNNADNLKDSLINFINKNRFNYANKQGLLESSKVAYWFNNPGVSFLRTPRAYALINTGDPDEFIYDFKVTAAMSFLKWIVVTHETNISKLISVTGIVPLSIFHFALKQCADFARRLKHEDIDKEIDLAPDTEWRTFLDYFYKAVHVGNHFKKSGLESEMSLVHKSRTMLRKLSELYPSMDMDGYMNIWILKPSYGSRGLGIHFCRTLQYVLKVVKENKNNSYVIQKYIERPLLIYNTKFDIRQWFLISSTQPITIWIYKECYLRFSSQTYNLRKLHESIHLTNNSVQSKYHNGNRDMCLPFHNMWFLSDFQNYLCNIGYPNAYEKIILPGMKECIVAAILSNQEQIFRTDIAFELHGADFMITEDFKPWLIEINSKPALNPSTAVTSKLCPMVLEDVIKVVIDNSRNPRASTGNFNLIYKEKAYPMPHIDNPATLRLEGKPVTAEYFLSPHDAKISLSQQKLKSDDSLNVITTTDYMKYVGSEMKKTLKQLLGIIEKERNRRKVLQNKSNSANYETTTYCHEMQTIQTNMQQIEEIFKREIFANESTENVPTTGKCITPQLNVTKASDLSLSSNSRILTKALTSLHRRSDKKTMNEAMTMVTSINFTSDARERAKDRIAKISNQRDGIMKSSR